jgi:hypothetical protein
MQDTAHAAGTPTAHQGGLLRSPRAGPASLEDACPLGRGSAPLEEQHFRRTGSASPEGSLSLEQVPPRSRVRPALGRGPPRSRAPLTRAPAPVHGHLMP